MNNESVLEALERAQYGTGDEDEMFDDRAILADAVRELAWFADNCAGNKAFFGGDRRRRVDVQCLADAIMEETYEDS